MDGKRTQRSAGGKWPRLIGLGLLCLGGSFAAQAHESYMDCFDNKDGTATCQAGYEDGSPPNAEDRILIKDEKGKTLIEGRFDEDGGFTFDQPGGNFMMIFIGGEIGHTKRLNASDLIK